MVKLFKKINYTEENEISIIQQRDSSENVKYAKNIGKDKKNQDSLSDSIEKVNNPLDIRFENKSLMEGIIYSEILGKPRCKRRGRWR